MRYCIITYGCQMNEADSGLMAGLLEQAGWSAVASPPEADLVVVNTCAVRQKPEQKLQTLLGQLRAQKAHRPSMVIAITGCIAQGEGERLAQRARHVDLVLGTRCFHHIVEATSRALAGDRPVILTDLSDDPSAIRCGVGEEQAAAPLRALVPIILGCTNFCSYCIVPYVRGEESSRPPGEIAAEIQGLVDRGAREVTLLGQNVLAWGRDLSSRPTFALLLERLDGIEEVWRIRFLTCHPRDVTPELADAVAHLPRVCEHIHLPIQAGTDELLREMNRGYTTDQYRRIVDALRAKVPGIAITTDIMVGFPGESEEDFEQSLALYESISFDAAFTFAYSPRPNTPAAARSDQVPRQVALERLSRLIEAQNRITLERNEREVGAVAEVLVEGPAEKGEGLLAGRTRTNKQVVFPGRHELIGSLVEVRLAEPHLWGFRAEVADGAEGRQRRLPASTRRR